MELLSNQNIQKIIKFKKEILIGISTLVLIIIGIISYSFYKESANKKAQKAFVAALKVYEGKVLTGQIKKEDIDIDTQFFSSDAEKWQKVEATFKKCYEENSSAGIAPIFLAYQAEALINLGEVKKAEELLKKVVSGLKDSALKASYQIKLALVQIDTNDQELLKVGLDGLKALALNDKNPMQDYALYCLGEYYWNIKNFDEVKNYWNQLIVKFGKTTQKESVWAGMAHQKLKLITSK